MSLAECTGSHSADEYVSLDISRDDSEEDVQFRKSVMSMAMQVSFVTYCISEW